MCEDGSPSGDLSAAPGGHSIHEKWMRGFSRMNEAGQGSGVNTPATKKPRHNEGFHSSQDFSFSCHLKDAGEEKKRTPFVEEESSWVGSAGSWSDSWCSTIFFFSHAPLILSR